MSELSVLPMLPVTATFLALCAILLMFKTGWIGLYRGAQNILRGDGGDPVLFKRIRIHGNFTETAPIAVLCVGMAERMGLGPVWLWLAVGSFFAGRIFHYMLYDTKMRGAAMSLVTGPALLLGIWMLVQIWA